MSLPLISELITTHTYEDPNQATSELFHHYGDFSSRGWLLNLICRYAPDEVYHLAAQSRVRVSFDTPEHTGDITGTGATNLLEAIRRSGCKTRFYGASSSEMSSSDPPPQNETSAFLPRSRYAVAKSYSYWMTRIYREGHKLFASNGILFNQESPRRGETFVTRKITRGIAAILPHKQDSLFLTTLDQGLRKKIDWYLRNSPKQQAHFSV